MNDKVEAISSMHQLEQSLKPRMSSNSTSSNMTYKTAHSVDMYQDAVAYEFEDCENVVSAADEKY